MLVAHAFARTLAEDGHSILFGLMGNTNLELIAHFSEQPGCRYVPVLNEDAAVCMASGYAQVTGKIGLATVIKGPGVTNTLTALTDAVRARVPLVVIAADAAVGVREGDDLQKVPQRDFVLPSGAGFEQVRTGETALADLREALRRAVAESRPIFLNTPLNLFKADTEYAVPTGYPAAAGRTSPDPDELDAAVGIIASARRPLILAGRGAATKDARQAILRLSARIGAPVMTTLRGKDLFRGEPGNFGIFGTLATDRGTEVIRMSDCVVAFGTSLNYRTTDNRGLLAGKAVVHVDSNRATIGRGAGVNAPVVGDAGVVAEAIVGMLEQAEIGPTAFLADARALTVRSDFRPKPHRDGTVDFHDALRCIERSVPADRVLTVDNGHFMYSTYKSISVPDPLSYVHTASGGSIGLGLGHALGAAFGAPDRPTLLVTGDGGFMCSGVVEFRTAVNYGLDFIVAVLNDAAYGAEYVRMVAHQQDPALTTFSRPDFAALGDALGGQGFAVTDEASLARVPEIIARRIKPLLIEFRIDPAAITKAPVPVD